MFGFLRTRRSPPVTSEVTADVTTEVTASTESTAVVTAVVTSEVTSEVTTELIPPPNVITKWAERKPYPPHDPSSPTTQIWWTGKDMPLPKRLPSAKQIAEELAAAMQRQPTCVGKWIPAMCIEHVICPSVCHQLGWPMRPWLGREGVASHLAKLWPDHPPRYKWTEINGERQNLQHYFIPHPRRPLRAQAGMRARAHARGGRRAKSVPTNSSEALRPHARGGRRC